MTAARSSLLIGLAGLLLFLPACGKKGPVRPLRHPLPAAPEGLAVQQKGERFLVAWSLPRLNQDGSPLADLEGFRVYKMRYDPAEECPECRDTSVLFTDVDLEYLREAVRRDDRLYLWDAELEPGFGYQYRVVPYAKRGREGAPAQERRPFLNPPAVPQGLAAAGHDRLVRLAWEPVAEKRGGVELLGYNLYRREGEGPFPFRPVNGEYLRQSAYDDFGLENGRTYTYAVRSVVRILGQVVESPLSATAAATPEAGR